MSGVIEQDDADWWLEISLLDTTVYLSDNYLSTAIALISWPTCRPKHNVRRLVRGVCLCVPYAHILAITQAADFCFIMSVSVPLFDYFLCFEWCDAVLWVRYTCTKNVSNARLDKCDALRRPRCKKKSWSDIRWTSWVLKQHKKTESFLAKPQDVPGCTFTSN